MDAKTLVAAYFDYFDELAYARPDIFKHYLDHTSWTEVATHALVKVGEKRFMDHEVAARYHTKHNEWSRTEYLTLDVVLVTRAQWAPPSFIAEHENSGFRARIQYDAWKLLSVRAKCRMLVAYFGRGTQSKTFADLVSAVGEVCRGWSNDELVLVGGEWGAKPVDMASFRAAHDAASIRGAQVTSQTPVVRGGG